MAERSGYSSAQIMAMQRDAIRRVNEMQRISQEKLRQTEAAFGGRGDPSPPASPPAAEQAVPPPPVPAREEQPPMREGRMPGGMGMENHSYGVNRQGHPGGQESNAVPAHHTGGGSSPSPPPEPIPPSDSIPSLEAILEEDLSEGEQPLEIVPASGLQGILQRMNLDSETVMLLMLLLLLVNEGADVMLIMALVYILL